MGLNWILLEVQNTEVEVVLEGLEFPRTRDKILPEIELGQPHQPGQVTDVLDLVVPEVEELELAESGQRPDLDQEVVAQVEDDQLLEGQERLGGLGEEVVIQTQNLQRLG